MTAASETPAGTLRRAAQLMRSRAGTAPQGPWKVWEKAEDGSLYLVGPAGRVDTIGAIERAPAVAAWHLSAEHIASWHPGVALAVAEWLEEVADDRHPELPAWVDDGALRIARAYLGEAAS